MMTLGFGTTMRLKDHLQVLLIYCSRKFLFPIPTTTPPPPISLSTQKIYFEFF
jgi:hypothetical protein